MTPEPLLERTAQALGLAGNVFAWCACRCYRGAIALRRTLELTKENAT